MDIQNFLDTIQDLTDLELAVLTSLIANEHCLISTEDSALDDLSSELALIVSEIFGLSYAVVSGEDITSVDRFGEAILDQTPGHEFLDDGNVSDFGFGPPTGAGSFTIDENSMTPASTYRSKLASVSIKAGSFMSSRHDQQQHLDRRMVANVIIAKGFNTATRDVQIAALELIQRRRIFSRTTVHPVPKTFLFIPLVSASSKSHQRLNNHLNDRIFISHYHSPEDGLANLEELDTYNMYNRDNDRNQDSKSTSPHTGRSRSRSRADPNFNLNNSPRRIDYKIITQLQSQTEAVTIHPEIRQYIQDIVVFLRMSRDVDPAAFTLHPNSHTPSQTLQQHQQQSPPPSSNNPTSNSNTTTSTTNKPKPSTSPSTLSDRIQEKDTSVISTISPTATTHLIHLSRLLAPLHGITFVTPSLVALAVRKIYAHRIVLVRPERDRSLMYGSDLGAVRENSRGQEREMEREGEGVRGREMMVIERILRSVECPV